MAAAQPPSRSATPSILQKRPLEEDHAPAISSPLNPDAAPRARPAARPPPREQREKRETIKKREASARGSTPDKKGKHKGPEAPSPIKYAVPEPKLEAYEPPKDPTLVSHEPTPIFTPDGQVELKNPLDRFTLPQSLPLPPLRRRPLFPHKQWYRQTDQRPFGARMSFLDSDKRLHFDDTLTHVTNDKGWRMGRGNVAASEGSHYYEVKILRGVPSSGPHPPGQEDTPQPHIRMGWARREAPSMRPPALRNNAQIPPGQAVPPAPALQDQEDQTRRRQAAPEPVVLSDPNIREGDVIGLEIRLPSLSLHRKVVSGNYNPAVDLTDGFDDPDPTSPFRIGQSIDVIRDRMPVAYKAQMYLEHFEYRPTAPMVHYGDRSVDPKHVSAVPSPNHEDPALRCLPFSSIRVYKNGELVGTAFENLMAFLPPASRLTGPEEQRCAFDDGMLGYSPAVAAFCGGVAQVNFGPDFWFPPAGLRREGKGEGNAATVDGEGDVAMGGGGESRVEEKRRLRGIGERFKEQVAEDIVWDIVDETVFFIQDGGVVHTGVQPGKASGASVGRKDKLVED
ncbi:transcription factor, contains a PHD finger motif [Coniosporium tulheliwenetii]|uniref:Transcription factor, contains a PHD finger motif n=1 Tax=Coniosporium tulheliwenetii TaxID=3383036 RepID=A0ACC2YUC2_9PEZI|nr:transcription factor, contains a PHD finger motif [Cladosporium sp. JES 115]